MFSGYIAKKNSFVVQNTVVESNFGTHFSLTGCKQVENGQAAEMLKVFTSKV